MNNRPEEQEEIRKLRESWLAKTDNPIIIFENYPFTDRGWYLPSFTPHAMGASINATKGVSQGEDIWLSVRQDFEKVGMGFNHFLIYFTQRMYWGGKEQDVDALFREYCRLFYGPAEQEMLAFFDYCEANWQEMEKDKAKADHALALFAQAQAKADAASVLRPTARLDGRLPQGPAQQEPAARPETRPRARAAAGRRGPRPDRHRRQTRRRRLGECLPVRHLPAPRTADGPPAHLRHHGQIRLDRQQPLLRHPLRRTSRREAQHRHDEEGRSGALVWRLRRGRCSETDSRSYYQIAVSPSGAVADLDRSAAAQCSGSAGTRRPRSPRTSPTTTGPSRCASRSRRTRTTRCIR